MAAIKTGLVSRQAWGLISKRVGSGLSRPPAASEGRIAGKLLHDVSRGGIHRIEQICDVARVGLPRP